MARYSNLYDHLKGVVSDEDYNLLEEAEYTCWEDIRPERAMSPKVVEILDKILHSKFHRDEWRHSA